MNKLLSYYTSLFGTSGSEGDIRRAILNEISSYADTKVDKLGNIIAFKKGKYEPPATVMLSAHMDEVGMILTDVTDQGYIRFDTIGGIDTRTLCGKHVVIGRRKIPGVIGQMAPHLMKKSDRDTVKKTEDLYIDIGAADKEDALKYVAQGDVIGFRSDYAEFGDGLVRAKALDDRIGCQILTNLIKEELPFDMYFAFTVMEEIGCIGAGCAAFEIKPDYSIVVEATTAADISDNKDKTSVCRVGSGPVISFMDSSTIYDRDFIKLACNAARQRSIPYQMKQAVAGGNDSGRIQRTASGASALAISVAVRYLHTVTGVASLKDIDNTERLVFALLNKMLNV